MSPLLQTFGNASARGYNPGAVSGGAYELISTTVTAGGETTITFSAIDQTYKHLQLRVSARGANTGDTDAGNSRIRINNTTTDLAYIHRYYGTGTAFPTAGANSNMSPMEFTPASSAVAGTYSGHHLEIFDYANTTAYKTVKSFGGFVSNSGFVSLNSYLYLATSAVTSVTFINTTAFGYAGNSRFSLYGIKG